MIRRLSFVVVCMVAILSCGQMALAGGPFQQTLSNCFCRDLPDHERVGCNGYLQFRIERGKDRQSSLDSCLWGCTQILSNPLDIQKCQKGCREANEKDW